MAIYDILSDVKDRRDSNGICDFNGYLEDYLLVLEEEHPVGDMMDFLQDLFERDANLKICTNLRLDINKDAIANQIIRYKDSFKLPHGTIKCPFIVYGKKDEQQKAMIITVGDRDQYVLAKALYYVMSEPENEYEGTRNEIIAGSVDEISKVHVIESMERFFERSEKAGIVQRALDAKMFLNYDELYETAQKMASYQLVNLRDILEKSADKEEAINSIIATWFLLKKFSYVQYMMDKNNLNRIHEGNVKKQRQVAKEKCDAIGFVSYSELWKLVKGMK